jgi:uncharacterized protein (TIGR02449 family)
MDQDLTGLEQRVHALIELAGGLRAANVGLRQQLAALQSENHELTERIATASTRIEALLAKLPATIE